MERVCFVLQVRPERLEEYKERHEAVWPEMLLALQESGWRNYSLFLRPDGMLVGYLETENFQQARDGMTRREVNARWQREMAGFFVASTGGFARQSDVSARRSLPLGLALCKNNRATRYGKFRVVPGEGLKIRFCYARTGG